MKTFGLFIFLTLALAVAAAPQGKQRGKQGRHQGRQDQQQGEQGEQQGEQGQQQGEQGQQEDGGDPQSSLTLDPRVIAKGFANNGQAQPDAGQVASLTSTNNFINFCAQTIDNIPLTDGKQIKTGSCNPAPIGLIPSTDRMPSSKFTNPKNGDNLAADQAFTISMAMKNLATGNFVNANQNYFAAPQQLDGSGTIIGHTHVTVDKLTSLDQTTPTDPTSFVFFKGVNTKADDNGVVSVQVDPGLPKGAYRLCSINSSSNHQPVIVPVAQHGSLDDCVYFSVDDQDGNDGQQHDQGEHDQGEHGQGEHGHGEHGQDGQQGQGEQGQGEQDQGEQDGQDQGEQDGQQDQGEQDQGEQDGQQGQ